MKGLQLHNAAKKSKGASHATKAGSSHTSRSAVTKKQSTGKRVVKPKRRVAVLMPEKLAIANDLLQGVQLPADW